MFVVAVIIIVVVLIDDDDVFAVVDPRNLHLKYGQNWLSNR